MKLNDNRRSRYLSLNSTDDRNFLSATHNPADFEVLIPNAEQLNGVSRITLNQVVIPRMFDTVDSTNDILQWYQKLMIEVPYTDQPPNNFLRTVEEKTWTLTRTVTLTHGQRNMTQILADINAVTTPLGEVWSYDSTNRTIVIVVTPAAPEIAFGPFFDAAHTPPATTYANMLYLGSPNGAFDMLGLQGPASTASAQEDKIPFDRLNANTFDAISGTNIERLQLLPLFNRFAHNYHTWATATFTTSPLNPPRITGPTIIKVCLTGLADGSEIQASSGTSHDVLSTVNIESVNFGNEYTKEVKTDDAESIDFISPVDIKSFRVQLKDRKYRQLTLPRNQPVHVVVQYLFVTS